jgi:uncharacterized protein (DUF2236 family)
MGTVTHGPTPGSEKEVGHRPAVPRRGTAVWRYFGDSRNGLLGPQLLVLQVAHPVVGAGVEQHSNYREDPWQRLIRTMFSLATLIYGGEEASAAESARLRAMHARIKGVDTQGRRYTALDPTAYHWVHATLVRGAVEARQLFGPGVPDSELEEYYRQMSDVGRILGLRDRYMPPDWDSFCRYYDEIVLEKLEDNQAVRDVIASVRNPKKPFRLLPGFVWWPFAKLSGRLAYLVTVGALPIPLRERLNLTWSAREERRLRRFALLVRVLMAMILPPLRIAPSIAAGQWSIRMNALADEGDRPSHA